MAPPRPPLSLRFDDFVLEEGQSRLLRADSAVALPPKALALLCALARRPGQLVRKDALLDEAWGHRHVSESVLKTTISQLRAALGDDAKHPRYIETASRHGYRFIGVPAAAAIVPAPAPGADASGGDAPIGRGAAVERLQRALEAALGGQRRIVWLAGEAGVGKTTLVEHFAARCGVRVALGQCVQQFGAGEPYLPMLEALAALCRSDPALVSLLRSVAPTWLLQLPWLCTEGERAALQQQLAGVHPDRMLREAGELLDRYTQQAPLVLVTEDLHWSDHATVRLLEHLARRRTPARLLWLGSFRSAELEAENHPLKGLRHELRLHRLAEELALEPFSEPELAAYLERRVPRAAGAQALVHALHAHTGGLPLFVANVVDELLAQGGLEDLPLRIADRVPDTLAGVVERQFERLPAAQQAMLEAAAVHGVEFRPDAVAAALQADRHETHAALEALARRGQWLRETPAGFEFRHALVRHAVLQRIGAAGRSRLHARIAGALERLREAGAAVAAAELASHHERGQQPLAALRCYGDAARAALGRFAPTEAAQLTERALALLPQAPEGLPRLELELALVGQRGLACSMLETFSADAARQAFERALQLCGQLPHTPQRAWVLSGLGWVLYSRGDYAAAHTLAGHIERSSAGPDATALQISACNLRGLTFAQQGDWRSAHRILERGLALCAEQGDALPLARFVIDPRVSMRAVLGLALLPLGVDEAASALCDEALAMAQQLPEPTPLMLALWCGGMLEQRLGRAARVREHVRGLQRLALDLGLAAAEGPALWLAGWAEVQEGDPRRGLALIAEGIAHHRRSSRLAGLTHVMGCAAEAMLAVGDTAAAVAQIEQALDLGRQLGEQASTADLLLLRARTAAAEGRHGDAARDFDAAAAEASARQARRIEAAVASARRALPH
ncbi:MAG: AAA family ATPase [Burkholderiaceae bacterium]|nr:AAA family ATPase [Burkholderiaceae bacterium]